MLLVFPSQKAFVLVFRGDEVPSDAEGFTPTDSATTSRGSTNPTHRFCYRAVLTKPGVIRPVVVPKYAAVPMFIIKNNLRTAGMSRERYFELLSK